MRCIDRFLVAVGLSVCVAGWAADSVAAGVPVDEATAAQKADANRLFLDAKREFEQKPSERSLEGFRASYEIVASPNALLMVGRALLALERLEEAYEVLEDTVRVAREAAEKDPKYGETVQLAQSDLDLLRASVGLVTLSVVGATDDAQVFLDGKPVDRERWGKEIPLRMGNVTLTVASEGHPEYRQVLVVGAGRSTHVVDLNSFWTPAVGVVGPVRQEDRREARRDFLGLDQRTWAYVAGGVGALGVVTYGVFGAMNLSKHSKLMNECPDRECPPEFDYQGDVDAGRRNKHIANAGFAVGIVGLGAGAALYVLSLDSKKDGPKASSTAQVGVGPGSVTVRGTF